MHQPSRRTQLRPSCERFLTVGTARLARAGKGRSEKRQTEKRLISVVRSVCVAWQRPNSGEALLSPSTSPKRKLAATIPSTKPAIWQREGSRRPLPSESGAFHPFRAAGSPSAISSVRHRVKQIRDRRVRTYLGYLQYTYPSPQPAMYATAAPTSTG